MFDTVVLDAALRVIPPFPLGSCVALSDGSQAVVTDLNESTPCQPKVHLFDLASDDGQPLKEIDLAAPDAPTIMECNAQKVGKFFYTLSETIDVKNLEDETGCNSLTREPKASPECVSSSK